MYQHTFSCLSHSVSFPCHPDDLIILSAKYGSVLQNPLISDLCDLWNENGDENNIYSFNHSLIRSFGAKIDSLQFDTVCDISEALQSHLHSDPNEAITTLITNLSDHEFSSNECHLPSSSNATNASYSYLFDIAYYCPLHLPSTPHSTHSTNSDYPPLMDINSAFTVDLSNFVSTQLVNPNNPESTYYLCIVILSILCILLLCGCYFSCIQCLRCYQYEYLCCACSCCHSLIQSLCCCTYCHQYSWLYYSPYKMLPTTKRVDQSQKHSLKLPKVVFSSSEHMQYGDGPTNEDPNGQTTHYLYPNLNDIGNTNNSNNTVTSNDSHLNPINIERDLQHLLNYLLYFKYVSKQSYKTYYQERRK